MTIARYDYLAQSLQGGTTGQFGFWLPSQDDAAAATVIAAIQNHTNATLRSVLVTLLSASQPTPGTPGTVPMVGSAARLTFGGVYPTIATIQIPMPNNSVYLSDMQTVDPSAIADVVSAVTSYCCTPSGTPLTALSAGRRATYPLPLWPQYP